MFRYGRTLAANSSIALQYIFDAIPLTLQTGNITDTQTTNTSGGTVTTFHRRTAYGAGLTPLGIQLNFRNRSRIKPFLNVGAGGLIFSKPVPLPDAGRFAFTLQGAGGVRILDTSRRSLSIGLKLHHISNGNLSGSNRGLNQFAVSVGYSLFK
jgi:Lipid A 3-O-deacylase (PagL)